MKTDFTEVMKNKTNKELVEITTALRDDYQPEAVLAAESELSTRDVDINSVAEEVQQDSEEKDTLESKIVGQGIRIIHLLVDFIAFVILGMIFGIIADLFIVTPSEAMMNLLGYMLLGISFFVYFGFMETKYQKTLGKFITKTKVVMSDGSTPLFSDILIRTACRLIPFDRLSFLFTRRGFHDKLSNTMVIKDKI